MPEDLRPPYRIQFDNARDPYTARNALGFDKFGGISGGGGGPAPYVLKAGDTMTGNLIIAPSATSANIVLNKPASGNVASIQFQTAGNLRWVLFGSNGTAESGSNAGSDFFITRYNDAGAALGDPFSINRASGKVSLQGTTTNDSAAAGYVGEYIESSIASASKVSLTSTTWANVTSITLTAGDWDVWGVIMYDGGATSAINALQGSLSTNSATPTIVQGTYAAVYYAGAAGVLVYLPSVSLVPMRYSVASTTTVYLVAAATFTVSTCQAYGRLMARRCR